MKSQLYSTKKRLVENILNRHLNWLKNDFDFYKILSIRKSLSDQVPFINVGTKEITRELKLPINYTREILLSDFDKINYLIIDDIEFKGNLDFVKQCRNLRYLFICGICSEGKIIDLEPLKGLKKLSYINLKYHEITDLKWLSSLSELQQIYLSDNPIKSIGTITHLTKIEKAELSEVEEDEVFELLKNNRGSMVSFVSTEEVISYDAYWIKDWAFKVSYFKDIKKINVEIAPLLIENFIEEISEAEKEDYVPILKQKTVDIAKNMLKNGEILIDNGVFVKMEQEYLNAEFKFEKQV